MSGISGTDVGSIKATITADVTGFNQSVEKAKSKARELGEAGKAASSSFSTLNSALTEVGASASQIEKINAAIRKANPDILRQQIASVRQEMEKLGASASQIDKVTKELERGGSVASRMTGEVKALGLAYTALAAAMVGVAAKAIESSATFEQSMANVKAISGATADEFARLREQALELGSSTVFSASQAADAQGFLAMAGFNTAQVMEALPGVLNLAAAGQMELGRTADIASNILTGFQLEASETSRVVDVMAKAMTSSNTNIEQLGYAMKYAAPVAASLGISIEEAAAAVGTLSNAGIQGEMAGTQLRAILLRLVKPPAQAAYALKQLGIETQDAAGNFLPFGDIIGQLEKAFAGLTEAQQAQAAGMIAGVESTSGLLTLINNGQASLDSFTKKLQNAGGSAQAMADTQLDTLNGAITEMKSALEGAGITVGDKFAPAVRMATEALTSMLSGFTQLSPPMQAAIVAFPTAAAVVLGLSAAVGALSIALTALNISFPILGAIALVVGGVTAGIAALTSASNEAAATVEAHNKAQQDLNETLEASPQSRTVDELKELQEQTEELNGLLEERAELQERINEIDAMEGDNWGMLEDLDAMSTKLEEIDEQLYNLGFEGPEQAAQALSEMREAAEQSIPALLDMQKAELDNAKALQAHITQMEQTISRYEELSSQRNLSEAQLDEETRLVNALKKEYPDLLANFDEEGRLRIDNIDIIGQQINAERSHVDNVVASSVSIINAYENVERAALESINRQIANLQSLASAMASFDGGGGGIKVTNGPTLSDLPSGMQQAVNISNRYISSKLNSDLQGLYEEQNAAQKTVNEIGKLKNELETGGLDAYKRPAAKSGVNLTKPKKQAAAKKPKKGGGSKSNKSSKKSGGSKGAGREAAKKAKKPGKTAAELASEAREKSFDRDLSTLKYQADYYDWDADEQAVGYKALQKKHAQFLKDSVEDQRSINLQLKRLNAQSVQDAFEFSEEYINQEERRMQRSGKTEDQISAMKETAWARIRDRYGKDTEYYKKADEQAYKARETFAKQSFDRSKAWIDEEDFRMQKSGKTSVEIAQMKVTAWKRVLSRYKSGSEEYKKADKELFAAQDKLAKAQLSTSEEWIKQEERRMESAGKTEGEITEMKLQAWTRIRDRHSKDSEYYKKAEDQLYNLRKTRTQQTEKLVEAQLKAEKSAVTAAKKTELDAIEERRKAYVDAQDAKIAAIDALLAKEAEQNSDIDYETQLAEKNARIDELASAVGPEGIAEREQAIKDRDRMMLEHERDLRKRDLESQKQMLQDEKNERNSAFDEEKAATEAKYDSLTAAFDAYAGDIKTIEAAIADFRTAVADEANAEILSGLDGFVAQYNAKMSQLQSAVTYSPRDADLVEYNANKDAWTSAKTSGNTAEMSRLTARNEELRKLYNIGKDTGKLQAFADGGIVQGMKGAAVPVIAHAGELVLNDRHVGNLFRLLDGQITAASVVNGGSSKTVEITNHFDMSVGGVELTDKADVETLYDERARAAARLQTQGVRV